MTALQPLDKSSIVATALPERGLQPRQLKRSCPLEVLFLQEFPERLDIRDQGEEPCVLLRGPGQLPQGLAESLARTQPTGPDVALPHQLCITLSTGGLGAKRGEALHQRG